MRKERLEFTYDMPLLEGMTSIRALFAGNKSGANDRRIMQVLYDITKKDKIKKDLDFLQKKATEEYFFHIIPLSDVEIARYAVGNSHGGILAECGARNIPRLQSIVNIKPNGFYAMIQGVEDPYNFGYALRSLYACGIDGVILPERNWLSAAGVVARSSAGASEQMSLYVSDPIEAANYFHERGYTVVCADERTDNLLHTTTLKKPLFLIMGGERRGISRTLLEKADIRVKIQYGREFKASLSMASAATMFAYEILRQNTKNPAE